MKNLSEQIKTANLKGRTKQGSPWKGPEVDGVTSSLLQRFLVCRERFRLYVVEGWAEADGFNHRLEYGNMWHVCEEALAAHRPNVPLANTERSWELKLKEYVAKLCERYPLQQSDVLHWYNVCAVQFPLYVAHWAKHPDVTARTPLLQEHTFCMPYRLPSGRTVRLRGKWDAVDLIGTGKEAGVYLQENKSKGSINEPQLRRQLSYDLQTMLYLTALAEFQTQLKQYHLGGEGIPRGASILGIRYNVVRRPLSGGKGNIVRHKGSKNHPPETWEAFYVRMAEYIRDEPESYFMRWRVEVSPTDVQRFRRETLDPILESLCNWWHSISGLPYGQRDHDNLLFGQHFRMPYGVYSPLLDGGETGIDHHLATGSTQGLRRVDTVFPELQEQEKGGV